jgi:hypothetical protein
VNDDTVPGARARHQKVLRAVTAIARYRRGLLNALQSFDGEDDWTRRWVETSHGEDNDIAAVERQFERIVNAWQDEIFDVIEAEATAQDLTPEAPRSADDADRWIQDAIDLGLLTKSPGKGQAPGRWGRHVLLGFMDPATPAALRPTADVRQLFQHRYTEADDADHGREVWQAIQQLLAVFPDIATDIEGALARLWPDPPAQTS